MSQFGTIGAPRMHPCVSHPSCSQYNAKDILLAIETKPNHLQNRNTSPQSTPKSKVESKDDVPINLTRRKTIDISASYVSSESDISSDYQQVEFNSRRKSSLDYGDLQNNAKRKEIPLLSRKQRSDGDCGRYIEVSPGVWSYQ